MIRLKQLLSNPAEPEIEMKGKQMLEWTKIRNG